MVEKKNEELSYEELLKKVHSLESEKEKLTEQLKTEVTFRNYAVEGAKEFTQEIDHLEADNETIRATANEIEKGFKDARDKRAETVRENHNLKNFLENKGLLSSFQESLAMDSGKQLGKFESKVLKAETKLKLSNKEYTKDDLKFYSDQERSKTVLKRAYSVANMKTKRNLHDLGQFLGKQQERSMNAFNYTAGAGEALAKGTWGLTGGKLVDTGAKLKKPVITKTKEMHQYLSKQLLRAEQKAMTNEDFLPSSKNSVIARAATLGSHKIKNFLTKQVNELKTSTVKGFEQLKMGGKMLLDGMKKKLSASVQNIHASGLDKVEKGKEKRVAKDGFEM